MQGKENDILISTVPFNGNRFDTAEALAEVIYYKLEETSWNERVGQVVMVDIPGKTNVSDKYCLAFVRLSDPSKHREFAEKFNGRITFKGMTLMIKISRSQRKELSRDYLENEIGWVSNDYYTNIDNEYVVQKEITADAISQATPDSVKIKTVSSDNIETLNNQTDTVNSSDNVEIQIDQAGTVNSSADEIKTKLGQAQDQLKLKQFNIDLFEELKVLSDIEINIKQANRIGALFKLLRAKENELVEANGRVKALENKKLVLNSANKSSDEKLQEVAQNWME